jgi:hypothetical protein
MEQAQMIQFNYNMSAEEMILAGKYNNADIILKLFAERNHSIEGSGEVAMPYLHQFGHLIRSENVVGELARQGLRCATLPELLLFGVNYPEVQRKCHIVAPDPVCRSYGSVPVLWSYADGEREMGFWGWGGDWGAFWHFAVVAK